jgi:hypothetical protein
MFSTALQGSRAAIEQWTVRASRRLDSALLDASVGPIVYDIVEPLRKVRFHHAPNKTQPIAFDILFEGELPPAFEERSRQRSTYRIRMDVVRYFQMGKLSGWVEIDGQREVVDDNWFGARDHSWGMRGNAIGALPTDLQPGGVQSKQSQILWGLAMLARPDGSKYQMLSFLYATDFGRTYSGRIVELGKSGEVIETGIRELREVVVLDPATRRFRKATYELVLTDGSAKTLEVSALGDSSFHLSTGGYGSWVAGGKARGAVTITRMASISPTCSSRCRNLASSATATRPASVSRRRFTTACFPN